MLRLNVPSVTKLGRSTVAAEVREGERGRRAVSYNPERAGHESRTFKGQN